VGGVGIVPKGRVWAADAHLDVAPKGHEAVDEVRPALQVWVGGVGGGEVGGGDGGGGDEGCRRWAARMGEWYAWGWVGCARARR
jgi:hypothetical protein